MSALGGVQLIIYLAATDGCLTSFGRGDRLWTKSELWGGNCTLVCVLDSVCHRMTNVHYADLAQISISRARDGKNLNSFANKLYMSKDAHKLSDAEIHLLCGLALEGGSDVVSSFN